jgi:hypothetical protein
MATRPIKLRLRRVATSEPSMSNNGVSNRRLSFSRSGLGHSQRLTLLNLFMLPPSRGISSSASATKFPRIGEK